MHQSIKPRDLSACRLFIRWNGTKRKVCTYLTYLLGLLSLPLSLPGRVALHPFSAHYYITSSNNDGRKQKHTTHYLQCFNSDGRRRNETGSPQTDQSMSNRARHEGNSNGQRATRAAMRQGRRSGERRRWLTGRLLLLMQIDGEI